MKKHLKVIACMLVWAFFITGCGGKVVAKVNDEKITEKDLNNRTEKIVVSIATKYGYDLEGEEIKSIKSDLQNQALEELILEKIILQDVKKKKITFDKKALEDTLKEIKASFPNEQEFRDHLKTIKFTEKEVKEFFRSQMLIEALAEEVTKDITKPSVDPQEFYNNNKGSYIQPETVDARHILVETEQEAKDIIERLDKGEDFTKLVLEKSKDPSAKENQGLFEKLTKDASFYEEFKEGAFSLKEVGSYTKQPVKSQSGYHIIKLEGREKEKQLTYDQVKEQLVETLLYQEKNQKFSEYVEELRKAAKIEKNLPEDNGKKAEGNQDSQKDTELDKDTSENSTDKDSNTEKDDSNTEKDSNTQNKDSRNGETSAKNNK